MRSKMITKETLIVSIILVTMDVILREAIKSSMSDNKNLIPLVLLRPSPLWNGIKETLICIVVSVAICFVFYCLFHQEQIQT